MSDYKTIAESNSFIVLDKYAKEWQASEHSLWDSQAGSATKQLRLEIIRQVPRDKLSPGIHT
jgi:hypothetical protein